MKIWTTEEEAENLRKRFVGINRAQFARDYGIKGGQASIYNHIRGLRPINLDAARRYAKGFGCKLEEISPRLAAEVASAAPYASGSSAGLKAAEPETEYSNRSKWPFDGIDERKLHALPQTELAKLEGALLLAAAQLGVDIKKAE